MVKGNPFFSRRSFDAVISIELTRWMCACLRLRDAGTPWNRWRNLWCSFFLCKFRVSWKRLRALCESSFAFVLRIAAKRFTLYTICFCSLFSDILKFRECNLAIFCALVFRMNFIRFNTISYRYRRFSECEHNTNWFTATNLWAKQRSPN